MHFQVPSGLTDWITIIDFQCNFCPLDLSLTNVLPKEMAKSPSWLLSEDSTSLLWGKLLQGSMSSMITCSGVRVS